MPGNSELLIIGAVIILLFGATALPKLARSIGRAKKEFKEGLKEGLKEGADDHDDVSSDNDS